MAVISDCMLAVLALSSLVGVDSAPVDVEAALKDIDITQYFSAIQVQDFPECGLPYQDQPDLNKSKAMMGTNNASIPNWHALTYMPEEMPVDPRWFTEQNRRMACETRSSCTKCLHDTFCSWCGTTMKCVYTPECPLEQAQRMKLLYEPDTGTNHTPGHCPGPDDEKPEKHGQCSKLWRATMPVGQRHLWQKMCKIFSPVAGFVKKRIEVLPGQWVEAEYPVDESGEPVPLEVAEAAGQPATGDSLKELRGEPTPGPACVPRQVLDRQQMIRMRKFKIENSVPPAGGILQDWQNYSMADVLPEKVNGLHLPDWKVEGAIDAYRPEGLGVPDPLAFKMADEEWDAWMRDPKNSYELPPNDPDPKPHPNTHYYTMQKGDLNLKGNDKASGYQLDTLEDSTSHQLDRVPWPDVDPKPNYDSRTVSNYDPDAIPQMRKQIMANAASGDLKWSSFPPADAPGKPHTSYTQ